MTRTMHDSFAKEWMEEILSDFGDVEIEKQIAGEVRKIDLYFCPNPDALEALKDLGLLGRMVSKPALLEPYRNAVSRRNIRNSRDKGFQLEEQLEREAKRANRKLRSKDYPFVWILTPTLSPRLQKMAKGEEKRSWGPGIYFLAEIDQTIVIAIHQLPKTIDTLFLRLLGRHNVQKEAVAELLALPLDHPYRRETLHHISRLQINLKLRQNKTKDLREVIMNLAPAYDKWLEEVEAKAIAKGEARGEARGEVRGEAHTREAIAQRMFQINLSTETIAQVTGLSIEFLQQLRSQSSI